MRKDRIEIIYDAIDQMAESHGKTRPRIFGSGKWNFNEEIGLWKKRIAKGEKIFGERPLTPLQWKIIDSYIEQKRKKLKRVI
jgi:hypothetical protein